jgi:hypothetical protein
MAYVPYFTSNLRDRKKSMAGFRSNSHYDSLLTFFVDLGRVFLRFAQDWSGFAQENVTQRVIMRIAGVLR